MEMIACVTYVEAMQGCYDVRRQPKFDTNRVAIVHMD